MASEWFVNNDDQTTGPFTVPQMKAQAKAGRIKPSTLVRKGKGKWIEARRVQGLLAATQKPATVDGIPAAKTGKSKTGKSKPNKSNNQSDKIRSPQVTGAAISDDDESTFLAPLRKRRGRAIIFSVLVIFMLIGRAPIHQQLVFDICMGLILGSYPLVEVKKRTIERTLMIFFYPAHKTIWKLRDFTAVETDVEPRIADKIGILIFFFFWLWFMFRLFDRVMPWLGGDYKLWLRQWDDERLLIWQGNNTADFEANLALLEATGLRIG